MFLVGRHTEDYFLKQYKYRRQRGVAQQYQHNCDVTISTYCDMYYHHYCAWRVLLL